MDIGATYRGKGKGKGKNKKKDMARATKEKDTNKEKATEATAHTTKERPKENSSHGTNRKDEIKVTKERQKDCPTKEESNSSVLQMWPARPHGKGLPNGGVPHVRDTAGTKPRWNSTVV